jgi:hypothetical protein
MIQKAASAIGKSQLEVCGAATITERCISGLTRAFTFQPSRPKKRRAIHFFTSGYFSIYFSTKIRECKFAQL